MRKILILGLLFNIIGLKAQNTRYDLGVDTLTYKYYLTGDWNKLIDSTNQALKRGIDFKYLRQRIGYAYFIKRNYFASRQQYEFALKTDKTDINSLYYLYLCGQYLGNTSFANYYAGLLPKETQKKLKIKSLKIVNAFDMEYNYKISNEATRGNPTYYRAGINTQLSYRLNLYQAFSNYNQRNVSSYDETSQLINVSSRDTSKIKQFEYFALLNWTITPYLNLNIGYHYLNSILSYTNTYTYTLYNQRHRIVKDSTLTFPGHLLCTKLTYTINRFDIGLSASILKYDSTLTQQYGAHIGVVLPGKSNIYLKSSLYGLLDSKKVNRLIFSQTAGGYILRKVWLEGNYTLGNLDVFSDNNGLYIYNSPDQTISRVGLTVSWNVLPQIYVFGNYNYDKKLITDNNTNYFQHSISSGIIWKL
jgi:hypothetical protein